MQTYRLTTEVFCLPHLDNYIVYAPLKNVLMLVNAAAANLLHQLDEGGACQTDASNVEILSAFLDMGIVNGPGEELHQDGDSEFRPTSVTLFLTTSCNLRCVYCYASGGDRSRTMPWQVAKAGIDLVGNNAPNMEGEALGLSFHGGGEPTVAWDLLRRTTAYAEGVAKRQGVECTRSLATNGVLSETQLDWIVEHIDDVNLSVDGVGAVHDRLRPLKDGGASFPHVLKTLRRLAAEGKRFGVRMTVTRASLPHVTETVQFLSREIAPHTIHLEPVFQCGRCVTESVEAPDPAEFVDIFRSARPIAEQHGAVLYYSGARYPQVTASFCQACEPSFTVTTAGCVTACYEVADPADPRADTFIYGRFDERLGRFEFDTDKMLQLKDLSVQHVPFCQRCFAKYQCAGDCPAKRLLMFDQGVPSAVSQRCRISQELTKDQIVEALETNVGLARVIAREHALAQETESHGPETQRSAGPQT